DNDGRSARDDLRNGPIAARTAGPGLLTWCNREPFAAVTESLHTIEESRPEWVSLGAYAPPPDYSPGRSVVVCALWSVLSLVVFQSGWVPFYGIKRWLLRCFGAS